jgi:hypothetical protein
MKWRGFMSFAMRRELGVCPPSCVGSWQGAVPTKFALELKWLKKHTRDDGTLGPNRKW